MPCKPQQIASTWLAALGMVLVGIWPSALWADCCCTARPVNSGAPTASCCCDSAAAVAENTSSCCAVSVEGTPAPATDCADELNRQGCQCDECDCQVTAAPLPIAEPRVKSSTVEATVAIVDFTTLKLESSVSLDHWHPPEVVRLGRPLREWFCVWVI